MSRITISLPEDMATVLAREAKRCATSVSELVRRALATQLGISEKRAPELPFVALGRSGKRHTARDAEEILAREWAHVRRR